MASLGAGLEERSAQVQTARNRVHGIRASNETWATQIKDLIQSRAPSAAAFLPTYRYFPMLDFALPWLRRNGYNRSAWLLLIPALLLAKM